MNYLRLLEEAHQQLERGELLAAEDLLLRARDSWARSRFRAPFVERGVEPVLRRAGKWLGRRSESPVLPVFGHRAARLEEDLAALARLLRDEALDLARQPFESQGLREFDLLERALRLDRQSRVLTLDRTQRWAVTRSYLQVGRRLARAIHPDLLPDDAAVAEDLDWLEEWAAAWLSAGATGDAAMLEWVHRQACAAAAVTPGPARTSAHGANWWWIAARAALHDPLSGPRALAATRAALESGLAGEARDRALRSLAGLLVNERILAGPGADVSAALRRHAPLAGSGPWPDHEIQALLDARRPPQNSTALVSAAWSDGGRELVLVSHHGASCADAIVLRPTSDPSGDDPFAISPAEARGWIHRWLPARCVLVLPAAAPPSIAALLTDRTQVRIDLLMETLTEEFGAEDPAAPAVAHPLWNPGPAPEPWSSLASNARRAIPVLRRILVESPAFVSSWGRANLRALAQHGLELCGALDLSASALVGEAPAADAPLQSVAVGVELAWLPLQSRPWMADGLGNAAAHGQPGVDPVPPGSEADTDVWVGRCGSAGELAAVAVEHRRTEVLTAGSARARAIAARAVVWTDPRTVTVAPPRERCAEPWLELLERWIRDAVADPSRQLDVVWLWRALVESAAGDPLARLGRRRDASVLAEIDSVVALDHECSNHCRLAHGGACWSVQLAARRERAVVWVVDLETSTDALDAVSCVVLDDPRTWVVQSASATAQARLDHAMERVGRAAQAWLWMNGEVLGDSILEVWRRGLRDPRPLHRRPAPARRAAAELWTAPPGYRPADLLLGREAQRLIELRAEALRHSVEEFSWWGPGRPTDGDHSPALLFGVADAPTARQVVCAELGGEEPHSDLLLLLRTSAALSHASVRAVVLDPRLAHVLGHAGGLWSGHTTADTVADRLAVALQPGSRLLSARHAHPGAEWTHPLTSERLTAIALQRGDPTVPDSARMLALGRALRETTRGRAVVFAGLTDAERGLVIDTIRALAEASGDGGPLGTRCVVVVGAPEHARARDPRSRALERTDDRSLGTVVLEVERGVVTRIDLDAALLADDGVMAWARRAAGLAWIIVRSERDLDADPLAGGDLGRARLVHAARGDRLSDAVERAHARLIAFADAESPAAARIARVMDGRVVRVEHTPAPQSWMVGVGGPESVHIACPHCEASSIVTDCFSTCPACGRRAWFRARGRSRIGQALEDEFLQRLQRLAQRRAVWALDLDAHRAHRLRARLGLQPWEQNEAPLLRGATVGVGAGSLAVLGPAELWEQTGPVPSVQVLARVRDADQLAAILARLDALGATDRTVELVLAPVGLDVHEASTGEHERWRWSASRTEVEFRLRSRLRAAAASSTTYRVGLGPVPLLPRMEAEATEVLDALFDAGRPLGAIESAVSTALVELERAGLAFGAQTAVVLPSSAERAHAGVLRWAVAEGLLRSESTSRVTAESAPSGVDRIHELTWERALRAASNTTAEDLLELRAPGAGDVHDGPEWVLPLSEARVGIAGSGKTTWLRECAERARSAGHRVLVVVPRSSARSAWSRVGVHAMDVVTAEEIALAFLRSVRGDAGEAPLRLLPPAGRADGEEARMRLMRETSRRYAAAAGAVPAIDAADLRRVVEDEPADPRAKSEEDLDRALLTRCAEQARAAVGLLTMRQLRDQCRRWAERERATDAGWSARYPFVAIDDVHDFHPELLAFARELLHGSVWWETHDPLFGPVLPFGDAARAVEPDLLSRRMPREWVAAIEVLWRSAPALPARPRTSRKGRDATRLRTVRVLALEAVHDWLVNEIDRDREPDRTAIAIAVEVDRTRLAQALLASHHVVRHGDRLARWSASGPRELIACLHLLAATSDDQRVRERLLACVLGPAFEARDGSVTELLDVFDAACHTPSEASVVRDPESARVVVLASLRGLVEVAAHPRDLLEPLLQRGVLDTVLLGDAAVGRLREILEQDDGQRIDDLLVMVPADFVAAPDGPSRALWLVGPDDLVPGSFDHVVHVCTGFESPSRHYRALAAATERFSLLHSERDPLR